MVHNLLVGSGMGPFHCSFISIAITGNRSDPTNISGPDSKCTTMVGAPNAYTEHDELLKDLNGEGQEID